MKKVLVVVAVAFVVVIAVAVAAPFFVPVETYKEKLASSVEEATGREFRIEGDFGISVFPHLGIEATEVSLANASGAAEANMAELESLEVRLKVLPLLTGKVAIDSFVLVAPVIHLEVDAQGRPNWRFGDAAPATAQSKESTSGGSAALPADIRLGDVRLEDGRVTYRDVRSGLSESVEGIDMAISLPDLDSPLEAEGKVVWHDEPVGLDVTLAAPRRLLEGGSSDLALKVDSKPVVLAFDGSAAVVGTLGVDGRTRLDVPSLRGLAAWAGRPLDMPGEGLGPLAVEGRVQVDGARYAFSEADLALDNIKGNGDVSVDTGKAKPYVKARLDIEDLDLNPYLPPEEAGQDEPESTGAVAAGAGEWSDTPLDLSALRALEADLALGVGHIAVRKFETGKAAVTVSLKGGKLTTKLTELALYEGRGEGEIFVDASGAVPNVRKQFTFSGIQAEPILMDLADFGRLTGTGNFEIEVSATGKSQKAMIETLDGSGSLAFRDGAIKGINLGAMIRNVSSAFLDPSAREARQTDFSALTGSFVIADGILRNEDLEMLAPLFRVTGKGTVSLPPRTVDYRVEPKVAMSAEGQGGEAKVAGIMVPIMITGPWHDLSYRPDIGHQIRQQIQDPQKALEALKQQAPDISKIGKPKVEIPGEAQVPAEASPPAKKPSSPTLPSPTSTVKKFFGK